MKEISFTPGDFEPGFIYDATLIFNGTIVQTQLNLVEGQPVTFEIVVPGTYVFSVVKRNDSSCLFSQVVQAFFPLVEFTDGTVDCNNNTYVFEITLTNPLTAGSNVQYGWSFNNDCSTVNNWTNNNILSIPADDITRYFFVKNDSQSCCNYLTQLVKSPCVVCTLTVTNISFNCNG